MSLLFKGLEPKTVWQHFEVINAIPRASTKEDKIIQYMINFGASLQLETVVDAVGNVIIKKKATPEKEDCRTVVLQGHLDMVHQKEATSNFDFDIQGIQMYIENDWVKAKETTLGADNGIGVAAIMAILSSNDIEHPPIEALFTIDEEAGMTGAMALTKNQLSGSILLNLDTEEEDEIIIGCAGGVDIEIGGCYTMETLDDFYQFHELKVDGLIGGHSGMDIHHNRANSIKIIADILDSLPCRISNISAGTLTNVIPRYGSAIIAVKKDFALDEEVKKIKRKLSASDPTIAISIKHSDTTFQVVSEKHQKLLLKQLIEIPNGVYSYTEGMPELVQTSNNLAKINLENGVYKIVCHTRSSIDKERDELVAAIKALFHNADVKEIGPYPGWKPQPEGVLLETAKDCYKKLYNKYPNIKSIHAGLECGILSNTFPNIEMISFGPNIRGAHTPEERLQISSTQRFWKFLKYLLSKI